MIGSFGILVYAYVIRYMAVGISPLKSSFDKHPSSYDDTAFNLGMGPTKLFRSIHLPINKSAIAIAFLITFVDIIKELPITLILRPFNFDTLAVQTYEYAIEEMIPKSSIYSLAIVMLGTILLIFLKKIVNKEIDVPKSKWITKILWLKQSADQKFEFFSRGGGYSFFYRWKRIWKNNFLKCLAGLEKINSGSIILNGKTLNDKSTFITPNKRKIGFVFQDYPLFPHLNVLENIKINLDKNYYSKIDYILELTNIKDLCGRFPDQLSGGEQQRACIARALVREPDLLLLDEPFSNLDSNIKSTIQDEIQKIIKETKTTTILVTHDIKDTFNISDKILIFKAGILQQYDNPVNMYCNPVNCYCAKILGDLNQISVNGKTYFIRPEKIRVAKKSSYLAVVKKQFLLERNIKLVQN